MHRPAARAVRFMVRRLLSDPSTNRFVQHNLRMWSGWRVEGTEREILVDLHAIAETHVAYSYFVNVLARRLRARIKAFSSEPQYAHWKLWRVYRAFNARSCVVVRPARGHQRRVQMRAGELFDRMRTKEDVFGLTASGIWIGIDIYESYLRRFRLATLDLKDPRLYGVLEEALGILSFWEAYLDRHRVAAVIVSHDCYIEFNILCKLAYARGIPVYLPYMQGITFADRPFSTAFRFGEYHRLFLELPAAEQREGLALAKWQLARRLSGEVAVDMPYATKSAFDRSRPYDRALEPNGRFKVLVCSHCFHDNPHAYGALPFVDFVEWMRYLGRIAEATDYDWYVKVHPDAIPGTEQVIRSLMAEYPRLRWVPPEISHHQLVSEGIGFVLTVYGSVGHEFPALGIQVLNASYNPQTSYGFNWHAHSLEEYERYLLNLHTLKRPIDPDDLYEFYYMHHYYMPVDDLFLPSYREFVRDLRPNERVGPAAYDYFLDHLTATRHENIKRRIAEFLDSGKRELFSRGPVIDVDAPEATRHRAMGGGRVIARSCCPVVSTGQ